MRKTLIEENWEHLGIAIESVMGETSDAYQAFLAYAFLQFDERTLKKTSENTGYSERHLRTWMEQFDWVERAKGVDATRWLMEFEKRQELIKEDNLEFIESNRKQKKGFLGAAEKMLHAANKMLDELQKADEVIEEDWVETRDGRWVATTKTVKVAWKASDIPRYVEAALKLQRGVNDLPTEVIETPAGLLPGTSFAEKTLDEIKAERDKIQKQLSGIVQLEDLQ
jgi:hypothetical protein